MQDTSKSPVLDVAEVCSHLGVSRPTFYNLVNQGRLTSFKIGRRRKVTREALDDFIRRSGGLPQ